MLRIYGKAGSQNFLTKKVIEKAKHIYKTEEQAYQSAFLVQSRQALVPYLQRGIESLPDEDEEQEIMKQIYDDVNDLYQDEHLIMTQADLLE